VSEPASEQSGVGPRALWLPFEVEDLDQATRFYTDRLGLSVVDGWDRDGERGVVLRAADGAFVELVSPGAGHPPMLAFEMADESEVDGSYARWRSGGNIGVSPPHRYPRGHYGFTARGPAGATVMVWSEK
jgi:catechol 2,3-dioxygenase-like lactoylglutathione lyase family enzyme